MIIFIIHHKGKLNGAKKISNEILDLAKKNNIEYKISPYPHDFKYYLIVWFIIEYFKFFSFHIKHFHKGSKIYFSGSNNTLGFLKDLPLILFLNLLYRKQKKIVHFHSSTIKLSKNIFKFFTLVYKKWTHIYLGQNLLPTTTPQKYHIISNYVNFPLKIIEEKNYENINIGYYGNIAQFKGIYDYNKIAQKFNEDDFLTFYSAGIGDVKLINNKIKHLGELINIKEKVKYLSSIDILVYPSYWDAQPLSILEAFHCNTAVISYDTGTISEMLPTKKDILRMGDIDGICKRIEFYKKNLKSLDKVKFKNNQQIINKFNKENFIHNVENHIFK